MTKKNVLPDAMLLGPNLTAEEARAIYARGEEAVVFALLELAVQLRRSQGQCASVSSPATPSGMKPVHQKPNTTRRRKKPGRKAGHEGSRRPKPEVVHEHKEHRAACCPHCQGPLKRCGKTRTRFTEDIPENIQPVVTENTIHRDWCPHCRKAKATGGKSRRGQGESDSPLGTGKTEMTP
jgi:transposase